MNVVALAAALLAVAAPGTVKFIVGDVSLKPAGEASRPAKVGDAVAEGAELETSASGRAEVLLPTGSVLRVGEGSHVALTAAQFEKGQPQRFSARVFLGSLWSRVAALAGSDSFEVETDNAVAGVRGTEFLVEAKPTGDDVSVLKGVVEVRDRHGAWTHSVHPGEGVSVDSQGKASGVHKLTPGVEAKHPLLRWTRERDAAREHEKPAKREKQDRRRGGR